MISLESKEENFVSDEKYEEPKKQDELLLKQLTSHHSQYLPTNMYIKLNRSA